MTPEHVRKLQAQARENAERCFAFLDRAIRVAESGVRRLEAERSLSLTESSCVALDYALADARGKLQQAVLAKQLALQGEWHEAYALTTDVVEGRDSAAVGIASTSSAGLGS